MSWRVVAGKDVRDAGRSKSVWALLALLSAISIGYAAGHSYLGRETFPAFLAGLAGVVAVVVPALAILLGYRSIADERASGSLALTLSFPHSRRDLIVGTVVGRTVVLLAPTLVALAAAGVVGAARYGTEGLVWYPWFLLATALYGAAFVGASVGLSMATTSDRRITFGALGGYLVTAAFWSDVHSATMLFLHRFDGAVFRDLPDWALLFRLVGPGESYFRLLHVGVDVERAALYAADGAPAYVGWWAAAALLVAWCLVPLALGFRRFESADL